MRAAFLLRLRDFKWFFGAEIELLLDRRHRRHRWLLLFTLLASHLIAFRVYFIRFQVAPADAARCACSDDAAARLFNNAGNGLGIMIFWETRGAVKSQPFCRSRP